MNLRQSKFVNLLMLLCFLPLGTLGTSFHGLVHSHHCCHSSAEWSLAEDPDGCSSHSLASHFLTWFDSSNRLLEGTFLAIEGQFVDHASELKYPGDRAECEADVLVSVDVPAVGSESGLKLQSSPRVVSLASEPALMVDEFRAVSGPIRAGPQIAAKQQTCGGDCHLSVVLRQIAVDHAANELEMKQALSGKAVGLEVPVFATKVAISLGSRGPPALA